MNDTLPAGFSLPRNATGVGVRGTASRSRLHTPGARSRPSRHGSGRAGSWTSPGDGRRQPGSRRRLATRPAVTTY